MSFLSKWTFSALTGLVLSLVGLTVSALPAASAQPVAPHLASGARSVDLHGRYLAALGHAQTRTIGGAMRPRGRQSHAPRTAGICAEPNCPVVYHGGAVQHSPRIYLLLWGPSWGSDADHQATATYLENFYTGLGTATDNWSTINSEYTDTTGQPSFTGSVYQGVWQDTTTPPVGLTQSQLAAEATAFQNQQGLTDLSNVQVVIASQSGTCPANFYSPNCNGGTGQYCAYHSWTSGNLPYTNLPYLLDAGINCGENYINGGASGLRDGFSIVGGHEYAESISDPYPNHGWRDTADTISGGENADKCAWVDAGTNLSLPTGTFAVQSIWSNITNSGNGGCVFTGQTTPPTTQTLTVTKSGTGTGTVSSVPSGTSCGTLCFLFPTSTPIVLTALPGTGSTFAGWSGDCTGVLTCLLTMSADHAVTATFTAVGTTYQESSAIYKGAWSSDSCACYNGGGTKYASKAGASATFTFTGKSIQFVSERAPDRGSFKVYLDGTLVKTVSDHSTTTQDAVPVWTKKFTKTAKHTLKIVVSGTSGHPRVDVDAFIVG